MITGLPLARELSSSP